MADKVAKMLKEMDEEHKHSELFKSMVSPDTQKMKEKRAHIHVRIVNAILKKFYWKYRKIHAY
jgi:Trp operon repressor